MMYDSIEAYSDIADNDLVLLQMITLMQWQICTRKRAIADFQRIFLRREITMTKKELSAMKKKTGAELQDFLAFKRRGSVVPAKKGKGSFKRKSKYGKEVDMCA